MTRFEKTSLFRLIPLVAALAIPLPASADDSGSSAIVLTGGLGFLGHDRLTLTPELGPTLVTETEPELAPAFGFRAEGSAHPALALGAAVEGFRRRDEDGDAVGTDVDLDFTLRLHGRWGGSGGGAYVEPFLLVPVGATCEVLDDEPLYGGDRKRLGFNVKGLLGLYFVFSSGFGLTVEGGYGLRRTYDRDSGIADRVEHQVHEGIARAGLLFAM